MKFQSQVYTAASGSIGGITYSKNRGGMYSRARVIPSNPATERQGIARENLATAVAVWTNETSPAQRQAWSSYAIATPTVDALGAQMTLSGQQMFIRSYTQRLLAGLDPVLDGPTLSGLGNTPQLVGDPVLDASTQAITGLAEAPAVTVDDFLSVYMSRPVPPSRTAAHEPTRFCGSNVGVAIGAAWNMDNPSAFVVTAGQLVRLKIVALWADGRISAEAFRDVLVVA